MSIRQKDKTLSQKAGKDFYMRVVVMLPKSIRLLFVVRGLVAFWPASLPAAVPHSATAQTQGVLPNSRSP